MKILIMLTCFVVLLMPILGLLVSLYLGFINRDYKYMIGRQYIYFMLFKNTERKPKDWDEDDCVAYCAVYLVTWSVIGSVLGAIFYNGLYMETLWTLGTIILLISPRYIKDIMNTLKYSFKSRESERLKELEEEVQKLKGKK